jgi:hypothetical protein
MQRIESLKLLASYGVKNDLRWIMRDLIQNFYDGARQAGQTNPFDHIKVEFSGNPAHTMIITGATYFDMSYLFYVGATSKAGNSKFIGEKGEGAKITTLLLMRDFGCGVKFCSSGGNKSWWANAAWQNVNIGGQSEQELAFEIEEGNNPNNTISSKVYVMSDGSDRGNETIELLRNMDYKSWFAYNDNVYLAEDNKVMQGVYRTLGNNEGRLFLAGLDRGFDYRLSFVYRLDEKIDGDSDRDRKTLGDETLTKALKKILVGNLPKEIYECILREKLDEFTNSYSYDPEVRALQSHPKFLQYFAHIYKSELKTFTYQSDYNTVVDNAMVRRFGAVMVKNTTLVDYLKSTGNKSIEQLIEGSHKDSEIKKTGDVLRRAKILETLVRSAGITPLDIRIFNPNGDDMDVLGTYNETFVRLNRKLFERNNFSQALATYVHELAHKFGPDGSPLFTDGLTNYMAQCFGHGLSGERIEGHFMMMGNANRLWNE